MSYNYLTEPNFYNSSGGVIPAGIHIGIVKSVSTSTKSVMVVVPALNDVDVIGPCRIIIPLITGATITYPAINSQVLVACLDGDHQQVVCLGKLLL